MESGNHFMVYSWDRFAVLNTISITVFLYPKIVYNSGEYCISERRPSWIWN
jgi:hypothetical protein